jgi:E3 ubiquitin-protein ligase NRDP1
MACCPTEEKYGYEHSRFEKDVDENFHCSICYNVLKEPRMCRNNEHVFCLACISEHLKVNSQTCPECNEHLSIDTLRRPRVVDNYLSKLKINCDYASRGCPEFTCVEGLQTHVANCEFAPVFCSNENCGMEINKQDKVYHETELCAYRKVKCHDCGQTREVVGRLEGRLMELDGKVQTAEKKMENNHAEMKKIVGKLEGSLVGMNKRINEKVEAIKNHHDEMKQEIKDMKENLSKVNKDVDEVKVMMSQMLEKSNMLELLNKLPSPTRMFNTPREDTLIAGGLDAINNAEIFSWEKNGWYEISQMNDGQIGASSFIYNHQLFVVRGCTKTIETLDLNELPLKWMEFSDKLPYESSDHQTVVYQQRVIHIGGYNCDEGKKSNVISELHRIESLFTHGELIRIYIYGTLTNYKILQTNKLQL